MFQGRPEGEDYGGVAAWLGRPVILPPERKESR